MDILLDKEQHEAVHSNANNIVLIAAAGSGKTRTLTERVKRLLIGGEDPETIVCITFTNLAAEEMSGRLSDVEGSDKVFIGTIHSYARLIHGSEFSLRTTEMEIQLIKELLTPNIFIPSSQALTAERYNEYQNLIQSGNKRAQNFLTLSEGMALEDILIRLDDLCKQRGILSFDELIDEATKNNSQPIINHLLVDEFQDVGRNEFRFVQSLEAANRFYVGDDWQSIYSFRGANVDIFRSLLDDRNFTTLRLSNNYRSLPGIIYASSDLISFSEGFIAKEVQPVREGQAKIVSTSLGIGDFIDKEMTSGNYGDWFILTRTNKDIDKLTRVLNKKGIPTTSFKRQGLTGEDLSELLQSNTVKILTVHVSKGLESKNVLYYNSLSHYARTDESYRIDYVAMTRAEDNLYLMDVKSSW